VVILGFTVVVIWVRQYPVTIELRRATMDVQAAKKAAAPLEWRRFPFSTFSAFDAGPSAKLP
jgi:hypothetical protein